MIALDLYEARRYLERMFPSLEFHVFRSNRKWRHYVVGVRPRLSMGAPVWLWAPMENFPDDALKLQLTLIA